MTEQKSLKKTSSKLPGWFIASVLLVLFISVALRTSWIIDFSSTPFGEILFLDSEYYDNQAMTIVNGDIRGGDKVFFFGPGYSYTLALIYKVFGHSLMTVRILQAITGISSALLVLHMATALKGYAAGIFAFTLIALNPIPIFYEAHLLMASFLLFMFTLFMWLVFLFYRKNYWWLQILSGVLCGIMTTYRGNFLIMPLVLWIAATRNKDSGIRRFLPAFISTIAMLIVILPITVRNYQIDGKWPVITSNVGVLLWHGSISGDKAAVNTAMEIDRARADVPDGPSEDGTLAEMADAMLEKPEESDRWLERVLWVIRLDTWGVIKRYFLKAGTFFNYFEIPKNVSFQFFQERHPVLALPLPGLKIISPLFILSLFFTDSWKNRLLPFTISSVLYITIISLFFINGRFRVPVLGIMTVLASVPFSGVLDTFLLEGSSIFKRLKKFRFILLLLVFLAALMLGNWPINNHLYPASAGYYQLAHVQKESGMTDEAIETLRKHIAMDPTHIKSYNDLVHLLMKENKLDEAASIARQGLNIMPMYDRLHFNLGIILARQGKLHQAVSRMETGLQYGYLDASAQKITGDMLMGLERYEKAAHRYREALKLAPEDMEAAVKLLESLYYSGRITEAADILQIPGVINAADPYISGHVFMLVGNVERAREQLFKVRAPASSVIEARCQLAVLALQEEDFGAALSFLEEALHLTPNDTSILFDLSMIYLKLGDTERSENLLRRLLKINPSDRRARTLLVEALNLSEKFNEARKESRLLESQ